MKTTACIIFAGLGLVAATHAGTPATQAPENDLWKWFAGASAGYVTGFDQGMYSLQAGVELQDPASKGSHAFYLEIAYTGDDASFGFTPGLPGAATEEARIDVDVIPITLNYRYEAAITENWNWYAGLGLGCAIVDTSYDWSWSQAVPPPNNHGGGSEDDTSVRFYGDLRAGVTFDVSDSFRFLAGVRYVMMDEEDHHIDVTGVSDYEAGVNNEFVFEAGMLWRF